MKKWSSLGFKTVFTHLNACQTNSESLNIIVFLIIKPSDTDRNKDVCQEETLGGFLLKKVIDGCLKIRPLNSPHTQN